MLTHVLTAPEILTAQVDIVMRIVWEVSCQAVLQLGSAQLIQELIRIIVPWVRSHIGVAYSMIVSKHRMDAACHIVAKYTGYPAIAGDGHLERSVAQCCVSL